NASRVEKSRVRRRHRQSLRTSDKTTKKAENAEDEGESAGEEVKNVGDKGENKSKTNSTARLGVAGTVDTAKLQELLGAQFMLTFRMAKAMGLSLEEILAALSVAVDKL
ncbi:hypothetical protein LTR04_004837, partial [Oleoguttula sp. CCFEE 6159]